MLVAVCDFPSGYAFPPTGYGGIERWLWAVAVGARRAGMEVHLLGPAWRPELADEWTSHRLRLEEVAPGGKQVRELRGTGYDLLVVGHEYPSLPAWQAVREVLDVDVVTFQHSPSFQHKPGVFDGMRCRLYCYSHEMYQRYVEHQPIRELAVHLGLGEVEGPAKNGAHLLWLGRIDAEKAPHLAIRAAQMLGRRITVAGPVFDHEYFDAHLAAFTADHVSLRGEVGGGDKMRLLTEAGALLYTCASDYVEAGAATFGESLRAGTPVAALAWRPGTCAEAALCERTGDIALVEAEDDDITAARAIADAVERTMPLRARDVQEVGLTRFDPVNHFRALSTRPC